jgi:uncharacterized protein YkwD
MRPILRSAKSIAFALALLVLSNSSPARADLIREINLERSAGCGSRPGVKPALRLSSKLNEAARRLQGGASLRTAMEAADYHGIKSGSIHMSGGLSDSAAARILKNRFCESLGDPQLQEIGYYRKGRDIWLVLAQPFSSLSLKDPAVVSRRVLQLVNEARSHARRCGGKNFAAVGPVQLSSLLHRAALTHSRDMADRNYFEHVSPAGSTPAQRVTAQGYKWRVTGENLAAGITTPEDAVRGWLDSPHHCENLMDPRFTEMGVAYVVEPASQLGVYWTQVFGLPR